MTNEAKQFFDGLGTPTAAEVLLIEKALVAGKQGVVKQFAEAFDRSIFPKARQDGMGSFLFRREDVTAAFAEAKKAIGL